LDDLGVDSLMATEVLNDIRSALGLTIDLSSFLFFPNIGALVAHVHEKLGVNGGRGDGASIKAPASSTDSGVGDMAYNTPINASSRPRQKQPQELRSPNTTNQLAAITSALGAFEETRLNYDQLAESTQAVDFWEKAYPIRHDWSWPTSWKASLPSWACDLENSKCAILVVQLSESTSQLIALRAWDGDLSPFSKAEMVFFVTGSRRITSADFYFSMK